MVGDNKMNSKEILEKIKILSNEEKIKINYDNLKNTICRSIYNWISCFYSIMYGSITA